MDRLKQHEHLHSVLLSDGTDVVGSGDSTQSRRLLLVVLKAFACKVRATTLRALQDDRCFDITAKIVSERKTYVACIAHRAASRTALAVEEEVTF